MATRQLGVDKGRRGGTRNVTTLSLSDRRKEVNARFENISVENDVLYHPSRRLLIEFCCNHDSELGAQAPPHAAVLNFTEETDCTSRESIDLALSYVAKATEHGAPIALWASIPLYGRLTNAKHQPRAVRHHREAQGPVEIVPPTLGRFL